MRDKDIEEMLAALEDGNISEDEEEISDENTIDYYVTQQDLLRALENEIEEEELVSDDPPLVTDEYHDVPTTEPVPGPSSSPPVLGIIGVAAWRTRSRDLIWKKRSMICNEDLISFLGNTELPTDVAQLETPFQFFSLYMNEHILTKIVYETNLYIIQKVT